jgi:hypothetical protein
LLIISTSLHRDQVAQLLPAAYAPFTDIFAQNVHHKPDLVFINLATPAKKPEASANPQQAKPQNLQPPAQGQQIAQRQPLAQPHTAAAPIAPANAFTAPQDGVFAQKLVQKNSPPHGDDRHSKNGYPVNPVHKLKPMGAMPRPQQMR